MQRIKWRIQKFASDEKGAVIIGFLMLLVSIYLCIAGLWNTSVLVEQKIQAQTVADTTAHTIAGDIASTVNEMTMLNMLTLRARSAKAIYTTCIFTSFAGGAIIAVNIAKAISEIANPATIVIGFFHLAQATYDSARLIAFIHHYTKASMSELSKIIDKCSNRQNDLYRSFGSTVSNHLNHIKSYLRENDTLGTWNIYATTDKASLYPTSSGHAPFLKSSPYIYKLFTLMARLTLQDEQWIKVKSPFSLKDPKKSSLLPPPSVPKPTPFFDGFKSKNTGKIMKITWFASIAATAALYATGDWGYDLYTRGFITEWNIDNPADRRIFQTLVFAERTGINNSFMAKGFFTPFASNTVLAASQAEAVNEYDELLHNHQIARLPVIKQILGFILKLPWRLWSSMGANYQPRLNAIDPAMLEAVTRGGGVEGSNSAMKKALKDNTGLAEDKLSKAIATGIFLH